MNTNNPTEDKRPKVTAAQLLGGIPVLAALLTAFGVYDLNTEQTVALGAAIAWAASLNIGDAVLRKSRNDKDAAVSVAYAPSTQPVAEGAGAPVREEPVSAKEIAEADDELEGMDTEHDEGLPESDESNRARAEGK